MPGPRPLFVDARQLERAPTGVAIWLRSILAEPATRAADVRLLTRGRPEAPGGAVEPIGAPSAAWHLVAAWRTRRAGGRYLSPDSFIVPILLGRRATLVVHDLTPVLLPAAHTRRTWVSHVLGLRIAVLRAGAVVVPSEATRDDLLRLVPRAEARTHVVAEAARLLPKGPPVVDPPFVLYVGTIEPRKNVEALVRAFRRAAPEGWRLVLAGKLGWLSGEAKASLADAVGDDGRVVQLGYVDDATLGGLYAAAGLFVYASSYEGFGLPVLEAMSHGVATVTTDAAALAEVSGGAAVCVPLDDLDGGLERTLADLLRRPEERERLAAAGLRRAEELSWRAAAEAVLELLQRTA